MDILWNQISMECGGRYFDIIRSRFILDNM